MAIEKNKNEKFVKTFVSKKRVYTFSLREKPEDDKDLLLVISEKVKDAKEPEFAANKIRIYNESLFDFFKMVKELEKEILRIKESNENK